jgi:DnaJ-like protein
VIALPSSLRELTLGDVIGVLHRERVSGALRLEEGLAGDGRRHSIHWLEGLIYEVETPLAVRSPGDTRSPGDRRLAQLEALFALRHARLSFSAMERSRRRCSPLAPRDFLHGRPRARDRQTPAPRSPLASARLEALLTLGLTEGSSFVDVRAAFKRLARRYHPDLHPSADAATKATLGQQFARIAHAYQTLRN